LTRILSVSVVCLGATLANGCGAPLPAKPAVNPVHGKVLLDGVPVQYGTVHLAPSVPGEGVPCSGSIGSGGTFDLQTFENSDGAAPGEYVVWIETYDPPAAAPPVKGKPTKIPARYQRPDTSGLTATVVDGEDTLPTLELKK
jgi:hypothetical protein